MKKQKKFIKELKKEASKTHNIIALWKYNCNPGLIFEANSQSRLDKNLSQSPNNKLNLLFFHFSLLPSFILPQLHKKR